MTLKMSGDMHNIHTLAIERKELRKTKNYYPTKKMRNFNKSVGQVDNFFCDAPKTVKINEKKQACLQETRQSTL